MKLFCLQSCDKRLGEKGGRKRCHINHHTLLPAVPKMGCIVSCKQAPPRAWGRPSLWKAIRSTNPPQEPSPGVLCCSSGLCVSRISQVTRPRSRESCDFPASQSEPVTEPKLETTPSNVLPVAFSTRPALRSLSCSQFPPKMRVGLIGETRKTWLALFSTKFQCAL